VRTVRYCQRNRKDKVALSLHYGPHNRTRSVHLCSPSFICCYYCLHSRQIFLTNDDPPVLYRSSGCLSACSNFTLIMQPSFLLYKLWFAVEPKDFDGFLTFITHHRHLMAQSYPSVCLSSYQLINYLTYFDKFWAGKNTLKFCSFRAVALR